MDPKGGCSALELERKRIGYTADLEIVIWFYSAIGCSERIQTFMVRPTERWKNPRLQGTDETLELLEVTLKEAGWSLSGEICDAKTILLMVRT